MSIASALIPELKHEAGNTRRVLQLLPDEHFNWKPHEKSFSLGGLAAHIAGIPFWAKTALTTSEFELTSINFKHNPYSNFTEVREGFEKHLAEAEQALSAASDEAMMGLWRLTKGGVKALELPRVAFMRSIVMNHTIHHRGELIVYMRLLNIKVPGLYGPSADEE